MPWQRPALNIVAHGGIGDVIMCTPALRELKRRNPRCRVRFYSKFGSLVRGLPYIDETLPYERRSNHAIYMDYSDETDFVAPRALFVQLLGDTLGLRVRDTRMDCIVDPALVARYRAAWRDLPRPHLAVVGLHDLVPGGGADIGRVGHGGTIGEGRKRSKNTVRALSAAQWITQKSRRAHR